uniref:FHA domain-containing protein n=1 Tax=Hucho hucho TaxID=62062 RepID=A0A4W5P0N6_9TELE
SSLLCFKTQVTIGRGLNVTHQFVSPSCPLMISRLHCMFKQRDDGQWTVTDKKSLNGVWVNGERIPVDKAQLLRLGDSIKLGVPLVGTKVEHEYILIRQRLEDIKPYLAKGPSEVACTASRTKKTKRKFNSDELEPSTSFKSKLYLCCATDKTQGLPCPTEPWERPGTRVREEPGPSMRQHQRLDSPPEGPSSPIRNLSNFQTYNMLVLREWMNDTQLCLEALEGERQQENPRQEEQVRELQSQLELLWGQLHRMEMLERSVSETEKLLWVRLTGGCRDLTNQNSCFFTLIMFTYFALLVSYKVRPCQETNALNIVRQIPLNIKYFFIHLNGHKII